MLRTRVITGSILGALLLLGLFLLPPLEAVLAFGAVFTAGAWEWAGFGSLSGAAARLVYALIIALTLLASWRWTENRAHLIVFLAAACAWWVMALLWLWLAPTLHRRALTLLCGVAVLAPAFVALARLQVSVDGFARGPFIVLWLVLMVCAADIGAYFSGRKFGRRKLAPRVSPGKTWEGAVGGLLAAVAVALGGARYFALPASLVLVLGCCVAVYSVIGDLTESMFKRAAALKDSGSLLPGHGGLLDRLDSVTAAAPLYALGLFGSGVIP
jgi:phosphatidate cytidylyltransferase